MKSIQILNWLLIDVMWGYIGNLTLGDWVVGYSTGVIVMILVAGYAYYTNLLAWNHGISRCTGLPWRYLYTNHTNQRGYCDGVGNTCWVSMGVDKRYNTKQGY